MTHYTRDYTGLSKEEAIDRAHADALDFMGSMAYAQTVCKFVAEAQSWKAIINGLGMFVGISGFAAEAMMYHYNRKVYDEYIVEKTRAEREGRELESISIVTIPRVMEDA